MDHRNSGGASRRRGAGWRVVLALALCFAGFDASALHKVDPGEVPKLAPDEGLLVVAVDTNARIDSLRVERVGNTLTSAVLPRIEVGRLLQMFVVPAGEYTWGELVFSTHCGLNGWCERSGTVLYG
ncbi:MAG TPA: hypothetical protein VGQ93_17615 [Lysobacter sp.]|jgi:hypothetical protein|nr:hypothetical protein [Lysobacter sp.]